MLICMAETLAGDSSFAVPGTVIHHVPAAEVRYVGCPSIVVLPSGGYLVSHSYFGECTTNSDSFVYRSDDRGTSWHRIAELNGQIWSKLFLHAGALYIIGTDHCDRQGGRLNGRMVIRRSDDEGCTWTIADSPTTGLLSDEDGYHTAPTAVMVHEGRIWKGFEFAPELDRSTWRVFVISAEVDADLLDRTSWRFTAQIDSWDECQWIEGNMVVTPEGGLVDVLRSNDRRKKEACGVDEPAALVHVSSDGTKLTHDADADRIVFPGGGAKFTVKRDSETRRYFALVNPQDGPNLYRNVLALTTSEDLRHWRVVRELLRHSDPVTHAFQYVDWEFNGDDIVFVSRTAYDDDASGAYRAHDANYATFHRITGFREVL